MTEQERKEVAVETLACEVGISKENVEKACADLNAEDVRLVTFCLSGAMNPPLWASGLVASLQKQRGETRS